MKTNYLKLSIVLESLSIMFVLVGMVLMVSACRNFKHTVTDTVHSETLDSDTTYQSGTVSFPFKGGSSEGQGNSLEVKYNYIDSVVTRDSIIYVTKYRYEDKQNYTISHPPVYAFNKYGYAKASMANNKLDVYLNIYEQLIVAKIDSAVKIVNNKKLITHTEKERKTTRNYLGFKLGIILVAAILVLWAIFKDKIKRLF